MNTPSDEPMDGGPAFPWIEDLRYAGMIQERSNHAGNLSVRDYFFAAALTGICANENCWTRDAGEIDGIVDLANIIADRAMKGRKP